MQETTDTFGPLIAEKVKKLEEKLGNVRVVASKSGKMTGKLISQWIREVLVPAVIDHYHPSNVPGYKPTTQDRAAASIIDTVASGECTEHGIIFDTYNWTCMHENRQMIENVINHPKVMLLADSWSGHSSERVAELVRSVGVKPLTIPPHTTDKVQPLDVGFFRQLKLFIRRITEEAIVCGKIEEITSREGVITLMSIIYNQLQAPAYRDLFRFAWRHTDANYSSDELTNNPPANVKSIQFSYDPASKCKISNCTEDVVIQSSYNRDHFCLTHFLAGESVHTVDLEDDMISMDEPFGPSTREDNIVEIEEDEDDAAIVRRPTDRLGMMVEDILYE